jgi:hypothetical protein
MAVNNPDLSQIPFGYELVTLFFLGIAVLSCIFILVCIVSIISDIFEIHWGFSCCILTVFFVVCYLLTLA